MSISLIELSALVEEYLKTFGDNGVEDERFRTPRQYAEGELEDFMDWLKRRTDQPLSPAVCKHGNGPTCAECASQSTGDV